MKDDKDIRLLRDEIRLLLIAYGIDGLTHSLYAKRDYEKAAFYEDIMLSRYEYLYDICAENLDKIGHECFIDGPDLKTKTLGIFVYFKIWLQMGRTWKQIIDSDMAFTLWNQDRPEAQALVDLCESAIELDEYVPEVLEVLRRCDLSANRDVYLAAGRLLSELEANGITYLH